MRQSVANCRKRYLKALDRTRLGRALLRRWLKNRNSVIADGVGAGLRLNPGRSNHAYVLGTNELAVQEVMARYLRPGGVFYDIGANIGFFTVIASYRAGPSGRVHAFEPVPENARVIRLNVGLNDFTNVCLHELAVSSASGPGELFVSNYSGGSTLSKADMPPDFIGTAEVRLASIDDLLAAKEIRPPDLVKIDVEGAELAVLKGMSRTIRDHRPIILFEIDAAGAREHDRKKGECDAFLLERRYHLEALPEAYADTAWTVSNTLALPD